MSSRGGLLGLLLAVAATGGCHAPRRTTEALEPESGATRIDLGCGRPEALARRAATELADSTGHSAVWPRVSAFDPRRLLCFARPTPVRTGTPPTFETLVENALVATGRFLLVEDPAVPLVRAGVTGPVGAETARVLVRGPGGDLWMEVVGRTGASGMQSPGSAVR